MSRIGRSPINLPSGVEVTTAPGRITVTGPRGQLEQRHSQDITIRSDQSQLIVERSTDRPQHRALHGLVRSLVANMVHGVTSGFEKRLEIQGVGYRAASRGANIELALGYSHPITVTPPEGISFELPAQTVIIIRGIDKQLVGQVAADIRRLRPPEPYKGKGIRYTGEHVARKVGKRA